MIVATPRGDKQIKDAARPGNPYRAFSTLNTDTFAGRNVSPEGALALSAVYGSVSLIANTCGTLPLEVVDTRKSGAVVQEAFVSRLLRHQPNADMSAQQLWTLVFNHLLLRGNAYLAKLKNRQGYVEELLPINPQYVSPFRDENGVKKFYVQIWDGSSTVDEVFGPNDILHIMGPSFDSGVTGASPLAIIRNRIGVQMAQSEFQGRFYERGAAIRGALSVPGDLTPEAADRIKRQWRNSQAGLENAHDIAVLHSGATFSPVSVEPADAQFIETMKFGATEIATIFGIPASRINADSGSNSIKYASSAQDDLHFAKTGVLPRVSLVESALNIDTDLFGASSPWVPKFNVDGVLRADLKTRYEAYAIGVDKGWLDPVEVRELENLNTTGAK